MSYFSAEMKVRFQLQEALGKAEAEIQEMEKRLSNQRAYAKGIRDALAIVIAKDDGLEPGAMRPHSEMEKVRQLLLKEGRPMRLREIAKAIGASSDDEIKSLGASLSHYVKRGAFKRPERSVYALPSRQSVATAQNGQSISEEKL